MGTRNPANLKTCLVVCSLTKDSRFVWLCRTISSVGSALCCSFVQATIVGSVILAAVALPPFPHKLIPRT